MKTTSLKSFMLLTCLIVFAVGCGKDGGGGGGSSTVQPPVANPVVDPNLNSSGQQALNNLKAWYANTSEPTNLLHRGTFRKETSDVSGINFEFSGSLCIGNWGINCGSQSSKATNCYIKNGDGVNYNIGTPAADGVTCTVTQSKVTKASNADLTKAVNGNGMILMNVIQQGKVFQLVYGTSNGYQLQAKAAYTIDTNYHSLLNPVIVEENGKRTIVKNLMTHQF